jgi:hypothetical protein
MFIFHFLFDLKRRIQMNMMLKTGMAVIVAIAAQGALADCENMDDQAAQAVIDFVNNSYGRQTATACRSDLQLLNSYSVRENGRGGTQYVFAFDRGGCKISGLFEATYLRGDSGVCRNTAVFRGTAHID